MPAAPLHVIVLAAGEGKRMKSAKPKVMMPLAGRSMLAHVLDTARALQPALPLYFQGEEWGAREPFQYFVSHTDQGLVEAVRKGRLRIRRRPRPGRATTTREGRTIRGTITTIGTRWS